MVFESFDSKEDVKGERTSSIQYKGYECYQGVPGERKHFLTYKKNKLIPLICSGMKRLKDMSLVLLS